MRTKPRIAYVGVGLMGAPMAARLLERDYAVAIHDVARERMKPLAAQGARLAKSAADAAREADLVLLNLPTTDAVERAVFGRHGVSGAAHPRQIVVDFGTTEAARTREFAARLRDQSGAAWIDAPVSGGPPASAAGTLTVMAGGSEADVKRLRTFMRDVSGRFTHMGPVGAGQVAKMVNQLIVGCGFTVLAEALKLAEHSGIDAGKLPDCLAGGYADSAMLQRVFSRLLKREFLPPTGYARQMLKDLEMVQSLARDTHTPTPMGALATNLYRMIVNLGGSEYDTACVLALFDPPGAIQRKRRTPRKAPG
jgi:3-hydroxyisobutyrate dehydrogenase-like beta-hydroxyacid dehydrogenase